MTRLTRPMFLFRLAFTLMIWSGITSCFGSKPVQYFVKGGLDTTMMQSFSIPESHIQKGDILSITVYSASPEASAQFNQTGGSGAVSSPSGVKGLNGVSTSSQQISGYLVDNKGEIRMHGLGKIKAEGLTREELENEISAKLKETGKLIDPYCMIRYNNFKITVLGEVRTPGVFNIPTERANVFEAIGLAGDISDYGLKDKVILVREDMGKRVYKQLDLTDPQVFNSPDFFLRQNDLIVVQSDTRKPTAVDQRNLTLITVAASLISTVAIFISIFK
jgi:polysaccharide biosynthesis/export protein